MAVIGSGVVRDAVTVVKRPRFDAASGTVAILLCAGGGFVIAGVAGLVVVAAQGVVAIGVLIRLERYDAQAGASSATERRDSARSSTLRRNSVAIVVSIGLAGVTACGSGSDTSAECDRLAEFTADLDVEIRQAVMSGFQQLYPVSCASDSSGSVYLVGGVSGDVGALPIALGLEVVTQSQLEVDSTAACIVIKREPTPDGEVTLYAEVVGTNSYPDVRLDRVLVYFYAEFGSRC